MSTGRNNDTDKGSPRASGLVGRIDAGVQKAQEWSILGLLLLLVGMTFFQVVLRNLPGNPSIPWIDLAARLLVLWVGLLGASLAMARSKHISIDLASRILPPGSVWWVRGATGLMSLVVLMVLFHASLGFTITKHQAASLPLFVIESLDLPVYEWFFTDLVPVLFLFMLWHAWVRWREDLGWSGPARAVSAVVGAVVALVVLGVAAVDLSLATLEPAVSGLSATLGDFVLAVPWLFFLLCFVLALLGAPLFIVIGGIALIGHFAVEAIPVQNFVADGIGGFRKSTIFLAIPLFTLAGYLMAEGKTPQRLVGLFRGFLGWLPGGVAIVALLACSFFTAFTGASGVTIIALGGLLLPILMEDRYPEKFSLGLLTTGGSRGLIFPPAIPVFLLAMIMGLSWDAVTSTGPYGSAVMNRTERAALCRAEVTQREAEVARDARLSAGDEALEEDIDRLLEQRLEAEGIESEAVKPEPEDEFELGDDPVIDAPAGADDPADEFELGDDPVIDAPAPAADSVNDGGDEFELGDDPVIDTPAPAAADEPVDEFELGEDPTLAAEEPVGQEVAVAEEVAEPLAEEGEVPAVPAATMAVAEDTIAVPSSTQIFTAGLIPGLLMVFAIAIYCIIMGFRSNVVRTKFTPRTAGRALLDARWELPIPILIGVGIFGGWFTPAEAASATAAYTIVMQMVLYRDFGFRTMVRTFVDSMVLVGGILIILVAAMGLLNFLVVAKVPDMVLSVIENLVPERLPVLGLFSIPRQITFLLMLNVFLLIVGCLMDIFSAILVVLPLLLPIAYRFGIHPAHLAVIFLTNLEIGYSTPPVGINLFVASLRFDKPVVRLYAASLAFLAIMFAGLLVITYWPGLSLWLVEATGVK